MSPPEVWGPAVWTLFHTLGEKINEEAYPYVSNELFKLIVRICKFLPCPECSTDASNFLAKIKISELKTKTDFKNTFYLFHNYVNSKKRKRLFNYANLNVYNKYKLVDVVNNFIANYHTKGNMRMLTESFQRQFVIKDFKNWFTRSIQAFIKRVNIPPAITTIKMEEVVDTVVRAEVETPIIAQVETPVIAEEETPVIAEEETPDVTVEVDTHVITEETPPIIVEENPVTLEEETPAVTVEETPVTVEETHVVTVVEETPVTLEEETPVTVEQPCLPIEVK